MSRAAAVTAPARLRAPGPLGAPGAAGAAAAPAEDAPGVPGWFEPGERVLCVSPATVAAAGGEDAGFLVLTDRHAAFLGRGGTRLVLGHRDIQAGGLREDRHGRAELWVESTSGPAVARGISGKAAAAAAAQPWVAPPAREAATAPAVPRATALPLSALWAAIPPLAAVVWALSVARVDPASIGDLGLAGALPVAAFVALGALCLSFVAVIRRAELSAPLLALHVLALVFMLYGAGALIGDVTEFNVTWRHVGVAEFIDERNAVDRGINAYFNWPGFFALAAFAADLMGVESLLPLARWSPLALNLLYLPALFVVARAATSDPRLPWAAVWVFFLSNWVYQDYFSPQGLVYVLYLAFAAVVLRWLSPEERETVPAPQRAALIVACFVIVLATAPSHQLTPFAMIAAAAAPLLMRRPAPPTLPLIALVLTVAWVVFAAGPYLSGHLETVKDDVGQLGSTVSANVGERVGGSSEHTLVTNLRIGFTALLWVLAAAAAARLLLRGRRQWLVTAALAAAPFTLVLLQAYGGEILLRVYMFSLPFVATLVAALFFGSGGLGRNAAAWFGLLVAVLATGFLFTRYGNERIYLFTEREVEAVERLERTAPPGSVLAAPNANLPWQRVGMGEHRYRPLHRELVGRPRTPAALAAAVDRILSERNAPAGYLVITRNNREYEHMFGVPEWGTIAQLERAVATSPRFRLVYANPDARVFRLRPAVGRGG